MADDGLPGRVLAFLERLGHPAARTQAGKLKGGRIHLAPAGWPDVTACVRGRFVGIECKRPAGKAHRAGKTHAAQDKMAAQVRRDGGIWILAHSVEDVAEILREEGLL